MALERGGFTDKIGNSYDSYWVAKQLLRLLNEELASVTVEPLGDDEAGVDVIIEHLTGGEITDSTDVELHQCKASNKGKDSWSLATLDSSGILAKAFSQVERNRPSQHSITFKVISPLSFNALTNLSKSAKNTNGNPKDFLQHQIDTNQERKKLFEELCERLKLDTSNTSDISRAINFLSHFEIVSYVNSSEDKNHLKDKADFIFLNDETETILSYLQSYSINQNKLRTKITADVLFDDLKQAGFVARKDIDNTQTPLVLDELCQKFTESIQPFFLNKTLISRPEIDECFNSIKENTITIIKAEAGMGKSAFLYELHSKIRSEGSISVPIRLDRQRPENSADEFGRLLGFRQSPVYAIVNASKAKRVVIILDQLDAIRWTANHSNNALQVCQEIARQIISLPHIYDFKLVMACRDFDLSEDIALKNWINDLEKSINKLSETLSSAQEVKQITLDKLPTEQVKEMVNQVEDYGSLPTAKQDILRIPIWLNFYLQITGKSDQPPRFDSKLELINLYWQDRLKVIEESGVNLANVLSIIDEFITKASQQMQYAIPQSLLTITNPIAFERLVSAGILHKNKQDKISFQHQALFDYQLGKSLYDKAIESEIALLTQIGDKSTQTLTRREHLKYALNLLLQDKQKFYARSLSAILFSEDIRFHLKYLAFHSLREILEIKQPVKKLVQELIADDCLSKHFIKHSCMGNSTMVSLLAELGFITSWLNHNDVEQINQAIQLLSTASGSIPELVAKEIRPFIGRSREWNERCGHALGLNVTHDSDDIFELRQKLFKFGIFPKYIDIEKLANKHPKRALQLVAFTFDENIASLTEVDWFESPFVDKLELLTLSEPKKLFGIAHQLPVDVIKSLIPKIYTIINNNNDKKLAEIWFYHGKHPQDKEKFISFILGLIAQASEQLASESRAAELWQLIEPYLHSRSVLMQHIILNMMFYFDISYSNQIIEWILDNPKSRLSSGNHHKEPKWLLASRVIEKFSPYCSDEIFYKLENAIYYAGLSKSFKKLQWIFDRKRKGYFKDCYWGELQYFIIPKLDKSRVSEKSKLLLAVLNRRFEHFNDEDFYYRLSSMCGFVRSPLPQPNTLSDKKWREILVKKDHDFKRFNGKQISRGTIVESTIESFSSSLLTAVTNQPKRFARLTLTLPKDIEHDYVDNIFNGLSRSTKDVQEPYIEDWQPCPIELQYAVIIHFGEHPHSNYLAWLLTKDTEVINHPPLLAVLKTMAKTSSNPQLDKLSIYDPKKGDSASIATAHELMNTSINSCRGIAYNGIADLFWENTDFAIRHKQLIDDAISDPHPAVQITSVRMLTPFLNTDEDFALQKFLDISHTDLRFTCAYEAYHFFNCAFDSQYKDDYIQLVKKMLVSDYDEVRQEAGRQIFARWYFNELFDDLFPALLETKATDKYIRIGFAEVLKQFLTEDKHGHLEYKLLEPYQLILNDKDSDVSNEVQQCIESENFWKKQNTKMLVDYFIQSIDGKTNISHFLYSLKSRPYIYPYKTQLLDIFSKLVEKARDEYEFSQRAHISSMMSVLQRIYDEAVDDEDEDILNQCLNVWDDIFASNIHISHQKVLRDGMLD
ncbi:hypothetical protein KRX19_05070 [Cardiobacteriaceae bacterium TAE3-ERU3]|nr:hypothetical protein [Cardiobacteriaceae bacterium TAE3-ERU3]